MGADLTTLCYLEHDGKYLMLHRTKKENDISHDLWMGVGGHFEAKETPEDCVIREVWEETGLTLQEPRLRGIVTFTEGDYEEYMFLFTADRFEGELKECNEGDLQWIPKEQASQLPCWEGDKVFLRLLQEDAPFFSLRLGYEGRHLVECRKALYPPENRN